VDTKLEKQIASTLFHCIKCGKIWGEGVDIGSSGICADCLAEWAKTKKDCYGASHQCTELCNFIKHCKDFADGIK